MGNGNTGENNGHDKQEEVEEKKKRGKNKQGGQRSLTKNKWMTRKKR